MLLSGLFCVRLPLRTQFEDLKLQVLAQVGEVFAGFADLGFGVEGLKVALSPDKVTRDHPESQKNEGADREVWPTAQLPVRKRKSARRGKFR